MALFSEWRDRHTRRPRYFVIQCEVQDRRAGPMSFGRCTAVSCSILPNLAPPERGFFFLSSFKSREIRTAGPLLCRLSIPAHAQYRPLPPMLAPAIHSLGDIVAFQHELTRVGRLHGRS